MFPSHWTTQSLIKAKLKLMNMINSCVITINNNSIVYGFDVMQFSDREYAEYGF